MEKKSGWWKRSFGGLIGIGLLLALPSVAGAGSVSLAWDPNSEPDLAGYKLYYGQTKGSYQFNVDVGTQTSHTVSGLADGERYYVAVTAYDTSGNESDLSDELLAAVCGSPTYPCLTIRVLPGTRIFLGGNYGYPGTFHGTIPSSGELPILRPSTGKFVIMTRLAGFLDTYRMVELGPGDDMVTLDSVLFDPAAPLDPTARVLEAAGLPITGRGHTSAPFVADWDNDGDKDLLVADGDGAIALYRNVGSDAAPKFNGSEDVSADGTPIAVPGPSFAFVVDWDGDNKKDLLVGDGQGRVRLYRNTLADATPQLEEWNFLQAGGGAIQVAGPAAPIVVDWNDDDKKDMLIGDGAGIVRVFLNEGTDANPILASGVTISLPDVGVARANARPFVTDWDQDGRRDLLVGDLNGQVYLFLNSGSEDAPAFQSGLALTSQGTQITVSSNAAPFVVDWNRDGLRDLVIGSNDGEVFLMQGEEPPPPAALTGDDGGAQLQCFIATAAYGSPLAPQVQLLREFRDRYLLPHAAGRALVAVYYTLSPPLADLIAQSEILRAIARVGLAPIVAWASLTLWSPSLGLGVILGVLGFGAWLALWLAHRRHWIRARCTVPPSGKAGRSRREALWPSVAPWSCVLFILASPSILEARLGEQAKASDQVDLTAEVRLPQPAWFALIRDPETGHLGLYKRGEPIHSRENPLPLGKIVAVRDDALIIVLPTGGSVKVPKGTWLPGPRGLIFVRSALVDTLRFQVRSGAAAIPGADYSVVDILGRRAILQRDAIPGEGRADAGRPSVPGSPPRPMGARSSGGSPPAPEGATLTDLVDRTPFTEVAPDTWEIPAGYVREVGNHLLAEALASATPSVTGGYGIALRMNTSLGSGTLDRRGFKIQVKNLARRTGLEVGDRILFVNGQPVSSLGGLVRIYRGIKSDPALSEVNVVVERSNQLRTLTYRIR